jgi:hypothetical protein
MSDKIMGVCDFCSEPHKKGGMGNRACLNWRPLPISIAFDKTVEVVENEKNSFGVWINGIFRPVDLGALVKILQVKDAEMDELKRENFRLAAQVQKLIFEVDNEREIGKAMGRCLKDEKDKATNMQMFGVSCVCKFQGGKVVCFCGAHQSAVDEAINAAKNNLAEKFRKLTENL